MTPGARAAWLLLVPILLAYGYLAVGYARATPRWNNPDEPAHVNVIRQIALTGTLPVLSEGDWDKPLLDRLTSSWFPNDYEVESIRYEGHQPPLYYLLAAPVQRLTLTMPLNRQLLALRLFSIAVGSIAVIAAFVVAREAAPDRPILAVLTAATVAFVPMNTAISAAINNDCLATSLAALTLAALMIGRRRGFSDRWAVGLGVLVGLLVLTKLTVYVYIPLILGTLLVAGRSPSRSLPQPDSPSPSHAMHVSQQPPGSPSPSQGRGTSGRGPANIVLRTTSQPMFAPRSGQGVRGSPLRALRWPFIASCVGLLFSGWWLVRNMLVYGLLDPLAMTRHDQIVVGQPRWLSYDLEALDFFARILFRSFWGMFGWMALVLDDGFYILYLVLMVLGVAGVLVGWIGTRRGASSVSLRHKDLLAWAVLLVFGEVAYYNLTFIQPQGRYLFPALVPIALFLAHGWWHLAVRATERPIMRALTAGALGGAIAWMLAEGYGALRAAEIRSTDHWLERLWSDQALVITAGLAVLLVLLAPAPLRRRLPDPLCLLLGFGLALLDLASLVTFVGPAFPTR
jgi:hypothetical protein